MSTSFQSNNSVVFGNLGMTSVASGITVTQTLYDSVTGQTTVTAFVPSPLNYVLGAEMLQSLAGGSYQTFTGGIVSLTTQSTRAVEISLVSTQEDSYIDFSSLQFNSDARFRVLRGPSTILTGGFGNLFVSTTGASTAIVRVPPGAFRVYDFSPPSGAATYILQAQTDNTNCSLSINFASLFARQL